MPLSEISNHDRPSDSFSRRKPPSEAASDQSSSLPPSAVLSMLRTTTELGDIGEFATRPPRIPRSVSRGQSTYSRSGSFDTSLASTLRHQQSSYMRRPRRHHVSQSAASPQHRFAGHLNRSHSRSNGLPRNPGRSTRYMHSPYPSMVSSIASAGHGLPSLYTHRSMVTLRSRYSQSPGIHPSHMQRPSLRASSPAYSDMRSYAATPQLGFMRAPSTSTVASSPAAVLPTGLGQLWRRPDFSTSYGSLKRFPSPVSCMRNSRGGTPGVSIRTITPMPASFQGVRSIVVSDAVPMADIPKSPTGSTVPAYYDYSESFIEEDCFSSDCGHATGFQSMRMDQMTFEARPPPSEREAQTPFGTRQGSVFRPLEMPTAHNRRLSEQSTHSKQSSHNFNGVIPKRVSSLAAPTLCKSNSVQSSRRCTRSEESDQAECEARRTSITSRRGNTPTSRSIFFPNAARSPRDLSTLAARVHSPSREGKHPPAGILTLTPDQASSAANPLCPANFEDKNTPNWQLPSMSFKPLSFAQYSPSHSGRPKTSEGTPCRRPLEILSPMPSRPVSSQSRKRFSNILELDDIHASSGKPSTSYLSKQKAAVLNKVEEVPDHRHSVTSKETMKLVSSISNGSSSPSPYRLYYDGTVDSDQRISQVTSQDKSTIESLLDRHIECLGLGPKSDTSSDESANPQDSQLDEQSSAEDVMQLSELMAKAPSWPKDRRWTSYSQQPSSLGTVERQMLRPRRLFASMDAGVPRTIEPLATQACSSDSTDQKSRRSYGWQTLPSSSVLASPPPTSLSSVSSGEVGDIDSDGQHPNLKVRRRSNLSRSLSASSRLSELSAPLPSECRESGMLQRSRSELVARESRRRRRIRMILKLRMKSRTLGNVLHADMAQHPIGDLPLETEEGARVGQSSSFKSPAAGYAELSAEAVPPLMYGLERKLSKPRPMSAQWSSIVVAMADPVKRGSIDIIRQASKYSKRSQRSNASVVQPINTSRIACPVQRPRSLPKIAPPDIGPQLTTSDLNLSIPYADVPSTIRPTLRESKSCFSDDSSAHFARRSLRQKFTLHSLRHALPGSRTSVVTPEMLRRGENTVTLSHSCQMKGRRSLDGNTWTGDNDKVVPMSDFAYRKRRVVEKIKCWWQKQCVLKKLRPMRRKDERRAPGVMAC